MQIDRRVVFGLIILFIILLIVKNWESSKSKVDRIIPDAVEGKYLAEFDRIPLIPPSVSPYYSTYEGPGGVTMTIADYTGVPKDRAAELKKNEPSDVFIIDHKFGYADETGLRLTEGGSIEDIDMELAALMSGRSIEDMDKTWGKLPPREIGRMLRETEYLHDIVIGDLIDQNLSDEEIDTLFRREWETIAGLPKFDPNCGDIKTECRAWSQDNDCIINSEFMLTNCPKSCGSCGMTPEQLKTVTETIYDSRATPNCVYRPGTSTGSMFN